MSYAAALQVEAATKEELVKLKGYLTWKSGQDCSISATLDYLLGLVRPPMPDGWRPTPNRPLGERIQRLIINQGGSMKQRDLLRVLHLTQSTLELTIADLLESGEVRRHVITSEPGSPSVRYEITAPS